MATVICMTLDGVWSSIVCANGRVAGLCPPLPAPVWPKINDPLKWGSVEEIIQITLPR